MVSPVTEIIQTRGARPRAASLIDARNSYVRAGQFCGYLRSRVCASMATQATFVMTLAAVRQAYDTCRSAASVITYDSQHSSNGRRRTGTQEFTQEQVSSDVPPAQKMGDLSRRARTPARLRIRSVYATEVICRPRSAPSLEHPSISSTLTVGDVIIADGAAY